MAKIYISSTYADLKDIRARAYAQLRKSRHDVISMEDYNPSGHRPLAKCLEDVRNSDIYVGIIGWRYGHVPTEDNPDGHSITEREYREAVAAGKEIVAFLIDEAAAWPPPLMDSHTRENGAGARIDAFRAHISEVHVRGTFSTAEELAAHLSPAIEEACARLAPASPEQLDNIPTLTSEQLQNLAARFGIDNPFDTPDPELRRLLTLKADEYRALKSEVDAIDDGLKRLSNLKAAAQEAIARVDLEEVEDLLSRVQEVELEEAAKTAELRANNALLRGKVDQAYRLFCAAADSFAAVDPLEPARRRILRYFVILRDHGLRFGGKGLVLSRELLSPILNSELRASDAWLWGAGENWRGVALAEYGTRIGGAEGAALLAEAVTAFRAALKIFTCADHPADWAQIQSNLGNALANQGTRTGGAAGAALLAEAVTTFRAALQVQTRDEHQVAWGMTQNNLGCALLEQGGRTGGAAGAALLAEAVAAYSAALGVRTRADHPVHWAESQCCLGNALLVQGKRIGSTEGTTRLAKAVAAYRAALEIYTRDDHPVDWAVTQNNLGIAQRNQGTGTAGAEGVALLAEAVTAFRAALEVRTRADLPVDWADTQNNLANALAAQGSRTGGEAGAALLAEAVTAYRAAQKVYSHADHPVQWALLQENIAITELDRARHEATDDARPHLEAALVAVEGALEVFEPEHLSYHHEKASRLWDEIRAELDKLP